MLYEVITPDMDGGLALLPVLIGLFAVSEILKEAETTLDSDRVAVPRFLVG